MIPPTRLLNILVDFSSDPLLQNTLVNEQKSIIKKYGKAISINTLAKMKYLDAAIFESLLLSSPANCMHRKVKKDVVLSNGITVSKDSYISINLFENHHKKVDDYGNRIFNISKHMERKTPKELFVQSLIWGFGSLQNIVIELFVYANIDFCQEPNFKSYHAASNHEPSLRTDLFGFINKFIPLFFRLLKIVFELMEGLVAFVNLFFTFIAVPDLPSEIIRDMTRSWFADNVLGRPARFGFLLGVCLFSYLRYYSSTYTSSLIYFRVRKPFI
ncbi:hypothetical protein BB560_003166 [Smittium megazygosporum]|uniref:Uncharacterized protein n=1 Tax=Smittium megazygosporum TaxID=133381 RepID=A0A2T9ZCS2_9FUNG|nr:hypothetical protein BB560_003166 [Smittium megazygosporum]